MLPGQAPVLETDRYVTTGYLASGAFGAVFRGIDKKNRGRDIAVKLVRLSNGGRPAQPNVEKEIAILRGIRHENVVALYDVVRQGSNLFLVMEFCNGGDLEQFLLDPQSKVKRCLREDEVQHLLRQVARALHECHKKDIVHRDLKPPNILLQVPNPQLVAQSTPIELIMFKLADFGFARFLESDAMTKTMCGSPLYMAPEIICGKPYDSRADLWSVATIVYVCLHGHPPFTAASPQLLTELYIKSPRLEPRLKESISPELRDLILSLLQKDPTQRLSFENFFSHPFIAEGNTTESNLAARTSANWEVVSPAMTIPSASPKDGSDASGSYNSHASSAGSLDEQLFHPFGFNPPSLMRVTGPNFIRDCTDGVMQKSVDDGFVLVSGANSEGDTLCNSPHSYGSSPRDISRQAPLSAPSHSHSRHGNQRYSPSPPTYRPSPGSAGSRHSSSGSRTSSLTNQQRPRPEASPGVQRGNRNTPPSFSPGKHRNSFPGFSTGSGRGSSVGSPAVNIPCSSRHGSNQHAYFSASPPGGCFADGRRTSSLDEQRGVLRHNSLPLRMPSTPGGEDAPWKVLGSNQKPLSFVTDDSMEGPILLEAPEMLSDTLMESCHIEAVRKLINAEEECNLLSDVIQSYFSAFTAARQSTVLHFEQLGLMDSRRESERLSLQLFLLQRLEQALDMAMEEVNADRLQASGIVKKVLTFLNHLYQETLAAVRLTIDGCDDPRDAPSVVSPYQLIYKFVTDRLSSIVCDEFIGRKESKLQEYQACVRLIEVLCQSFRSCAGRLPPGKAARSDIENLEWLRTAAEKRVGELQRK